MPAPSPVLPSERHRVHDGQPRPCRRSPRPRVLGDRPPVADDIVLGIEDRTRFVRCRSREQRRFVGCGAPRDRRDNTFAVIVFGAVFLVAIGVLVAYSPMAGLIAALVPLVVWLVGKAREPVLPWIAIVGIVFAGINLPGHIPLADVACALALVLCINKKVEWPTRMPRQVALLLLLVFLAVLLSVVWTTRP